MTEKWDRRLLELAAFVAGWSKDPSTKVGAVIADHNNRIVAMGYNGPPRGTSDDERSREHRLMCTIHAEENALLFARTSVVGMTIYVTRPPCANCAAKIVQAGIARVVTIKPPADFIDRWAESLVVSGEILDEAGVKVDIK